MEDNGKDRRDAQGTTPHRVLLVDDHVSVRQLLVELLARKGVPYCTVVGEAATGTEGRQLFRKLLPSLVIVALALPEMTGAELVRAVREERPETRVLVYTGTGNRQLIVSALEARPHGFVHKSDSLATLREALTAVVQGACYFSPYATRFFDDMGTRETSTAGRLSPKERQVLQLVAEGLSTKQVAAQLLITPKTTEHYRSEIMRKLGLRDVASLTRYAVRSGLVEG